MELTPTQLGVTPAEQPEPLTLDIAGLTLNDRRDTLDERERSIADAYSYETILDSLTKPAHRFRQNNHTGKALTATEAIPKIPSNLRVKTPQQLREHQDWHEAQELTDPRCPYCDQPNLALALAQEPQSSAVTQAVKKQVSVKHNHRNVYVGQFCSASEAAYARLFAYSLIGREDYKSYKSTTTTKPECLDQSRRSQIELQIRAALEKAGIPFVRPG